MLRRCGDRQKITLEILLQQDNNEFAIMFLQRRLPLACVFALLVCGALHAQDAVEPLVRTVAVADFQTCPKPEWPKSSLRLDETGTVTLGLLIAEDGTVIDSVIKKSSGHASLDEAALTGVRRCRFKPTAVNGEPYSAWMTMQYVWTLLPLPGKEMEQLTAQAEHFRSKALGGDMEALYELALIYRRVASSPSDHLHPVKMLRLAAERGHAKAQYELAHTLAFAIGTQKDTAGALEWYRKSAASGEPRAQSRLGSFYDYGVGMASDAAQAAALYRGAAAQGDTHAQLRLGHMTEIGRGTEQHLPQAAALYRQAGDAGDVKARIELARMYLQGKAENLDAALALQWLRTGAQLREPRAEALLASMYLTATLVEQDNAAGLTSLRLAATGGDAGALALLGHLLLNGIRTEANVDGGLVLLRKAAALGSAAAHASLAQAYDSGKGVPRDPALAQQWRELGARAAARIGENTDNWLLTL